MVGQVTHKVTGFTQEGRSELSSAGKPTEFWKLISGVFNRTVVPDYVRCATRAARELSPDTSVKQPLYLSE